MREEVKYICDRCQKVYETAEAAPQCEDSHITPYAPYQNALEKHWKWEPGESSPKTIYLPFKSGNTTWIVTYVQSGFPSLNSHVRKTLEEEIDRQRWWDQQSENNP